MCGLVLYNKLVVVTHSAIYLNLMYPQYFWQDVMLPKLRKVNCKGLFFHVFNLSVIVQEVFGDYQAI